MAADRTSRMNRVSNPYELLCMGRNRFLFVHIHPMYGYNINYNAALKTGGLQYFFF